MKIIFFLTFSFLITNITLAEEKKCLSLNKLSKEFIICAAKNIKDGTNRKNKQFKEVSSKKTKEIASGAKEIINKVKNKIIKN
ncbi:hypothetical protein IDH08_03415 [Pelagibacterales bacterium SAG-MED22]|nr:hypothetical protein [Pelagibacterales bacterium SAG-MED22]